MDTITDLLSTIFVSEYSRKKKHLETLTIEHTQNTEDQSDETQSKTEKNSVIDLTTSKETIQIQTDADFLIDEDSEESVTTRSQTILAQEFYNDNDDEDQYIQNSNEKQTQTEFNEYESTQKDFATQKKELTEKEKDLTIAKRELTEKEKDLTIAKRELTEKEKDFAIAKKEITEKEKITQKKELTSQIQKKSKSIRQDNETFFTKTEKQGTESNSDDTELSDTLSYSSDIDLGLTKSGVLADTNKEKKTKIKDDIFSDESDEYKLEIKKYVLRPNELYKKNILIVNIDKHDNINILSDLINSFSGIEDVKKIYNQDMYIVTNKENKKTFKKMLLDNPYLHFINIHIKSQFNNPINTNDKRTIVIIHLQSVDDIQDTIKQINPNSDENLQFIIISDKIEDRLINVYEKLGDNKILLHKKESTKALQKTFFQKVIQYICTSMTGLDFAKYYEFINQKKFGVKYIIIKNTELRYY
jgi:hypothetical protein